MADVENPDDGGAVEAEPTECCRCMVTCATGFFFAALVLLPLYTMENYYPTSNLLLLVEGVLVIVASLLGCWFAVVFMILVAEWWYNGHPEGGQRFVDGLIQSDRGFLQESVHLFLRGIDDPDPYVDA